MSSSSSSTASGSRDIGSEEEIFRRGDALSQCG
jgi:HAUS augmin-like complex subunit 1